jgi:hypothetical protein
LNPPNAVIGITPRIWLGLFDKLIKVSLRGLPFFEVGCGNSGAHDHGLFVQDARVDYEHESLDVGRACYIGNCTGLHPLREEFFSQESTTFQTLLTRHRLAR